MLDKSIAYCNATLLENKIGTINLESCAATCFEEIALFKVVQCKCFFFVLFVPKNELDGCCADAIILKLAIQDIINLIGILAWNFTMLNC